MIDEEFEKQIKLYSKINEMVKSLENKPSLSYGLSITYIKYPMHEALKASASLLFETAKHTEGKNCIAYRLLKHSGQTIEGILGKSQNSYDMISDLMNVQEGLAFNSVMHNLENQESALSKILHDKERVCHFFENNYNEDTHTDQKKFFCSVSGLLYTMGQDEQSHTAVIADAKKYLYLSKYLNQKEHV